MINEEKITKQVKSIMDNFIRALDKAKGVKEEFGSERECSMRAEIKKSRDPQFRERMFRNAPKKTDDFLVMEKKSW
ncbi:hypothetical protein AUJ83_00105 [Candidatus Woesearchaeota archaeon CG1_02_33_12]|nr:MAG: hypothetical protein AUJ83_00105 [Candidatus Woesearchaeota archaeon CG1_02_33_12]PIN78938.1 MAG: hypothetical protein COV14_01545 [Candidatus Woesearchaeota archaeon CG10_big_fil_rev_8_21_14_0_10_33_12]